MRKRCLGVTLAIALVAATVHPGLAQVNCDAVNKQLKLGRWAIDIADEMNLTLAQIRACEERAKAATTKHAPAAKTGTAPKGATPQAQGGQRK